MNNHSEHNDGLQRTLEALLSRAAIAPKADFATATLKRLREQPPPEDAFEDAALDALLMSQPIEPTDEFTQTTLSKAFTRTTRWLHFPIWASAAAAVLTLGLFLMFGKPAAPQETALSPYSISSTGFIEAVQLADPVSQAEVFLDEQNLEAIVLFSSFIL